jgi:hypothetical protein
MLFPRRDFISSLAILAAARLLPAQTTSAHIPVATLEHDHILASANSALKQPLTVLRDNPNALRRVSNTIAALTAAFLLTHEDRYALRAGQHLYAWLVEPTTRLNSTFPNSTLDAIVPLAELIRSLAFLTDTAALSPPDLTTANLWLKDLQTWLNTDKTALIARDAKDHAASAWLLLTASIARTLANDNTLDECRHRFRKPTLRNQINAAGAFPHEIATAFPLRNTLFNFDLLCGACQLLSSPFDDLWHFELEDGPGMRSIAAALFPLLQDPAKWPAIADAQLFRDVPLRRPALLFAGRAYNRPEYVDLWRTLPTPDLAQLPEPLAATYPITQPILWTTPAPHGL